MEEEGRVRERVKERTRAAFYAGVFIIFGIIAFRLYGLPAIENAVVREVKAEVMGLTINKMGGKVISRRLELRVLETGKIENMELKKEFPYSVEEMDKGNIYKVVYKGLWGKKEIISIELIQSREELVKKMSESDEIPDISKWYYDGSDWVEGFFKAEALRRFAVGQCNIFCRAYYDTTKEKPILMVKVFEYTNNDHKVIARKVCIKEGGIWTLHKLDKSDKRDIDVSKENGKVKFELR